ncbi:hypothetical protein KZ483_25090 [Paenibacillus sp. sptzw28]|uniref:hypothetical protein n=1 Tax=Paenibacillus sp. sptzw28 TaxID=715179 RepID=UPI001C6E3203|nr:hypothetical protein [Paenibacillus sp. sptzw28]QYR20978.1 hypothetical protein KZ483_25090 [Paenibacillus sp. sptzw28]
MSKGRIREMRKGKSSISLLLVRALGLVVCFKVLIYVLEHFVLQVTGVPELKIDDSYLNIAFVILCILFVIRILFVFLSEQRKKHNLTQDDETEIDISTYTCAKCGETVSEKVRQYCLSRPQQFNHKVYCYDHQKITPVSGIKNRKPCD